MSCRHKVSRFLLVASRRWPSDACSLVKRQFMAILPPLIALLRTRARSRQPFEIQRYKLAARNYDKSRLWVYCNKLFK